jgi:hypothetical protein
MNRSTLVFLVTVCLFALQPGCDHGESPKPAPAASSTPGEPTAAAATGPASTATASSAPATLPVAHAKYPEDLDVDATRDPQTRDKAAQLNAIRPENLKTLKPGDDAIVLVRADKGGGALYGSGPYTLDSSLRRAVVHAGVLEHNELGLVRLKVVKFDGDHLSEPRNGVTPAKWGKYHASFAVEKEKGK